MSGARRAITCLALLSPALVAAGCSSARRPVTDFRAPSERPPSGLSPEQVPLFVVLGFDDNGDPDGVHWVLDRLRELSNPPGSGQAATFDGAPARASFYVTGDLATDPQVADAWRRAFAEGQDLGVHSATHETGLETSRAVWRREITGCLDSMEQRAGIPRSAVSGFRTPFLAHNEDTFRAVVAEGLTYDCSLEEGFAPELDGTNFPWPYTLDQGSPGNELLVSWQTKRPAGSHAGLWELPVYAVLVPPDEQCASYGVEPGLRDRLAERVPYFDPEGGKITGFDYNLWTLFGLTADEMLAVLRYTLDQRLVGNRAPFLFGTHSDTYGAAGEDSPGATLADRRRALVDFLAYAASLPEVRVVSGQLLLQWLRDPQPLG